MPDVGILNLQIHDDSAKAAEGLSKLVAKLEEMKNAASGIRLNSVATGIGKLAKAVNDEISGSTIAKLNELADVLQRISSASGNVGGIRISFGGRGQSAEDMATQLQAARDTVAQTTAGFEQIGQRVQEDAQGAEAFANTMGRVNEIVQQTGGTAQATAEQFAQMFQVMNSIRMSGALGGGAYPFALGDGTGGSGAGWTEWKEGAIEVEGTVTEAMDAISLGAGNAVLRLTGVVDSTSEIASSVQEMADESERFSRSASEFDAVSQSVEQATSAVQDYNEAIEFARQWNASGASASAYKGQESADIEYVNNLIQSASQADLLSMRIDALRDKLYQMAGSGKYTGDQIARMVSQIQNLQAKLDGLGYTADDVKKSFSEIMLGSNGLNGAIKRMFPTITGLLSRFKQLVKYRMLRAVIKQIAEGFREGTENYYRYSQAIGGEFATKMDNAATALLQMKNSIGAAVAQLISSLIPYLQMAVDWFINIVNYANQFVALLRGQATWSRAVPKTTKAFEDQTKAAKKTGAAIKDLLADWDELNIIQSESGGGSGATGTSAAEDYLNMFEEVSTFDNKVKDITNFLSKRMSNVMDIVKDIGLAILGWKFSKAFGGMLGKLGSLVTIGMIVKLSADVTTLIDEAYVETENGAFLIADAVATAALAGVAGKLATAAFGKEAGVITGGITIAVSAGATFAAAENAKSIGKDAEAETLSMVGVIKTAIADALVTAGFLAAGVALPLAIVGGVATVGIAAAIAFSLSVSAEAIGNAKKTAEDAFANSGTNGLDPKKYLDELQTKFNELTAGDKIVLDTFVEVPELGKQLTNAYNEIIALNPVIFGNEKLTEEDAKAFKAAWGTILETLDEMNTKSYDTILAGLDSALAGANEKLQARIAEIRVSFIQIEKNMDEQTAKMYKEMEDIVGKIANGTATDNEIQDYKELWASLTEITDGSLDEMRKTISKAKRFDFGQDNPLENAQEFINDVGRASAQTTQTVQESLENTLAAIDIRRQNTELLHKKGKITDEAYNQAIAMYADLENALTVAAEAKKSTVANKMQEAYDMLFTQAFSYGGNTIDNWRHILLPLLSKIHEAGGKMSGTMIDALSQSISGEVLKIAFLGDSAQKGLLSDIDGMDAESIYKNIQSRLAEALEQEKKEMPDYALDIIDMFNLTGWDLIPNEIKEEIRQALISATEDEDLANDVYNNLFGIHTEVPVEIEPVPEIVGAETTESFDFDADVGVVDVPVEFSISTEEQQALRDAIESAMSDGVMDTSEAMDLMVRYGWNNYDNMMKELQYSLDEEGRNRGMMVRPIGMIASAGVSDVGWIPAQTYEPIGGGEPLDMEANIEGGLSEDDVARGTERGTEAAIGQVLTRMANLLQIIANNSGRGSSPSSATGAFALAGINLFNKVTGNG